MEARVGIDQIIVRYKGDWLQRTLLFYKGLEPSQLLRGQYSTITHPREITGSFTGSADSQARRLRVNLLIFGEHGLTHFTPRSRRAAVLPCMTLRIHQQKAHQNEPTTIIFALLTSVNSGATRVPILDSTLQFQFIDDESDFKRRNFTCGSTIVSFTSFRGAKSQSAARTP